MVARLSEVDAVDVQPRIEHGGAPFERLMSLDLTEDARSLEAALTRIDEAQRLAGELNQDANAVAADAAKTIGDVLGRMAKR
jgi:hypothetical protein